MFEQAFKIIDDVLWKEAGCSSELDHTEQTSWLLFLKCLDGLEQDLPDQAALADRSYTCILDEPYRREVRASPRDAAGALDYNSQSGYNMREIIDHIDELRFRSQAGKHELSHLYEARIRNMGDAGRNGGEHDTPRPLIRAMVKVTDSQLGETIYDGAVGSAGFPCEAYDCLKATNPDLSTAQDRTLRERTFYGKEKKSRAYVIAIMNMILHGIEAPRTPRTHIPGGTGPYSLGDMCHIVADAWTMRAYIQC